MRRSAVAESCRSFQSRSIQLDETEAIDRMDLPYTGASEIQHSPKHIIFYMSLNALRLFYDNASNSHVNLITVKYTPGLL